MPCTFAHEAELAARGFAKIAGVDEAGRGPLAGPVVAAAVILPPDFRAEGLNDSKKLTPAARRRLFATLTTTREVVFGLGRAEVEEIDQLNILRATHLAMRRAVDALAVRPDHLLIDGLPVPSLPIASTALVRGDALSLSIAAASILAKVSRDEAMEALDREYPAYEFARHKGYGTALHLKALAKYGPCPAHRRSFAPVARRQLELAL
jgi:ribonuclease HII